MSLSAASTFFLFAFISQFHTNFFWASVAIFLFLSNLNCYLEKHPEAFSIFSRFDNSNRIQKLSTLTQNRNDSEIIAAIVGYYSAQPVLLKPTKAAVSGV